MSYLWIASCIVCFLVGYLWKGPGPLVRLHHRLVRLSLSPAERRKIAAKQNAWKRNAAAKRKRRAAPKRHA